MAKESGIRIIKMGYILPIGIICKNTSIDHRRNTDANYLLHPNCKCTVEDWKLDPWQAENLAWSKISDGDFSIEQRAQLLMDLYRITAFSSQFVRRTLSATEMGLRSEDVNFSQFTNPATHQDPENSPEILWQRREHSAPPTLQSTQTSGLRRLLFSAE